MPTAKRAATRHDNRVTRHQIRQQLQQYRTLVMQVQDPDTCEVFVPSGTSTRTLTISAANTETRELNQHQRQAMRGLWRLSHREVGQQ